MSARCRINNDDDAAGGEALRGLRGEWPDSLRSSPTLMQDLDLRSRPRPDVICASLSGLTGVNILFTCP